MPWLKYKKCPEAEWISEQERSNKSMISARTWFLLLSLPCLPLHWLIWRLASFLQVRWLSEATEPIVKIKALSQKLTANIISYITGPQRVIDPFESFMPCSQGVGCTDWLKPSSIHFKSWGWEQFYTNHPTRKFRILLAREEGRINTGETINKASTQLSLERKK